MKIPIKIKYRKVTNSSLPAAEYFTRGYVDKDRKEHIRNVIIKVDPILKKPQNKELKRIILSHEITEVRARIKNSHGLTSHKVLRESHRIAESKEPSWFNKKFRTHSQLQRALRSTKG